MYTQHSITNDGCKHQIVEDFGAEPPHKRAAELSQTFVVEAVDLRNLSGLMVAANQRNPVRIPNLISQQQQKRLHGKMTSVHEIAHEDVRRLRYRASDAEQLQQVVELAVDVAA
ncbi:MAG: hypothetical protein KVP17_001067 [Porospora cf. gigantea B]|uniref:uncharacterized protein n=1 Tax=Porospora cf. gigantea B TaxID=2853592 RepID=UPI003571CADF|nr:MAG: hypothetical protein KVP17_001067 [Porospora cf. gigantea B]